MSDTELDAMLDDAGLADLQRFANTDGEELGDALLAMRRYTPTAFHWALNVAAWRVRTASLNPPTPPASCPSSVGSRSDLEAPKESAPDAPTEEPPTSTHD